MALAAYQQQTQRLLNDEANQFFNIADLTTYINLGRNDISRQTECLIAAVALATAGGTQTYATSALMPVSGSGLLQPINVRNIRSLNSGVSNLLEKRPWQWFSNYYLNGQNSILTAALPTLWAQQTQGSTGTIWVWPIPNAVGNLIVEASWTPIPLASDSDPEALPYPWTDCVPYFAAYIALLQAQRLQDAGSILQLYDKFIQSARLGVTPQWLPGAFPTPKPMQGSLDQTSTLNPNAKPAQRGEGAL